MGEKCSPSPAEAQEKKHRPIQIDFSINERTDFGLPGLDNYDYLSARDEEFWIEEYATPEGEKRVRYTEKYLEYYDQKVKQSKNARSILEKTTIKKMLGEAERHTPHSSYVPKEEGRPAAQQETVKEDSAQEAKKQLWDWLEKEGLKDKVKDIICAGIPAKGKDRKKAGAIYEVKVYLKDHSDYLYFTGTIKTLKKSLAEIMTDEAF